MFVREMHPVPKLLPLFQTTSLLFLLVNKLMEREGWKGEGDRNLNRCSASCERGDALCNFTPIDAAPCRTSFYILVHDS